MQIILLSGGSGKRLWPLSNEVRSKQFLKIFKTEDGNYESMVQRIYTSLKEAIPDCNITIATAKTQVSSIFNQLEDSVDVCVEPERRDTFPAIALASQFLKDVKGEADDETVVVCPVDPYVGRDYFECIKRIGEEVRKTSANITLMGIKPTYPSEKYGYIVADKTGMVNEFKEKPNLEAAKKLMAEGALWNGGVFGFKLGYMIDKAHELINFKDYEDLLCKYKTLEKISIDYAVIEKEKNIKAVIFEGDWMDVGTWKTMTHVMKDHSVGNVIFDETCENTHVINELEVPVLAMGLKDVVVAASADGIIVADKHQSSYMKPYVDKIEGPTMYAEKSWGSYKVMDIEEEGITVKVTLNPGHSMNYHSHERRDESWTVISGEGVALVDGKEKKVSAGDVILLPKGCKHCLKAISLLKVMEVQVGSEIDVNDKIIYKIG